jgi:hypothetical protein
MRTNVKAIASVLSCFVVSLTICLPARAGDVDRPPNKFVDVGAGPFECCTYKRWVVRDSVQLLDRPNGRRVVGVLRKGEAVKGLTGEVISIPVAVKADREVPETAIRTGDTFYVLHYDGEGYWKVWFRGQTTFVHQSVINVPKPKAEWWVKVRRTDGMVGWTPSEKHFLHQDACE